MRSIVYSTEDYWSVCLQEEKEIKKNILPEQYVTTHMKAPVSVSLSLPKNEETRENKVGGLGFGTIRAHWAYSRMSQTLKKKTSATTPKNKSNF